MSDSPTSGPISRLIRFCLEQKLVIFVFLVLVIGYGVRSAPFDWDLKNFPRDPVAVDAIPDLGENQQIVFTKWPGRSPQDVEDQITYPLTVSLLGVPGVRTVRSFSMFGFSSIYVIFEEDVEFYWSRSRVLERLSSLPSGTLPSSVQPALGPDATPLGQIFWYTLEGRDPEGNATGGWGLDELRSTQDWIARYALASAEGISEVSSIGGFVREYQVDVDPDAMRAYGVSLEDVFRSVRMSNEDVGARTVEINRVEYVIRGLGFLRSVEDLERTVVQANDNVPIRVKDVANVSLGPALRRGALDKNGVEAVGGVVVVRYGYNPLEAIDNIKLEIARMAPGLPVKILVDDRVVSREEVRAFASSLGFEAYDGASLNQEAWLKWYRMSPPSDRPSWVTESRVTLVPFYDRTGLIQETLGTLSDALYDELMVTLIVVILMVMHLSSSLLIGSILPLAIGMCFVLMKLFGIDANIVALSGIAIAIGTMVDMGVVMCENILSHLSRAKPEDNRLEVIHRAASEVGGAVVTAVATTVVGFLPVFAMTGAEGKLFQPLAYTKTFALISAVVVALILIPPAAHILFRSPLSRRPDAPNPLRRILAATLLLGAALLLALGWYLSGSALGLLALWTLVAPKLPNFVRKWIPIAANIAVVGYVLVRLADHWSPLGVDKSQLSNFIFAAGLVIGLLLVFRLVQVVYPRVLRFCLDHKLLFLCAPALLFVTGLSVWLGFERVFSFVPESRAEAPAGLRNTVLWQRLADAFPGLGKEFMPDLDEGSFLWMPSTMAHASIGESLDVMQLQDRAINSIPEVESVIGKLGRVDSPLDPAPIGMFETIVNYLPEYRTDENGDHETFAFNVETSTFERDEEGLLIPDEDGRPFRQWRDEIQSTDDIWREIADRGAITGSTSAPKLQPIAARLVMLQSGMRAPMGIKILGPNLETIEAVGLDLERLLKEVPGVKAEAVLADRTIGKPYLEIELDRDELARFGLTVGAVQEVIEVAVGGKELTRTVEGRERYAVRVRYQRELRDDFEGLEQILIPTPTGAQIPLRQLAEIRFERGPQAIKSEDTFLIGYVIFDRLPGWAEVDVVENCEQYLAERIESGELSLPAGVRYAFTGTYENQLHAQKTMSVLVPLSLLIIFLILYLQFKSVATTLIVWSGVLVSCSGGFVLLWLFGRAGFLDFEVLGSSMRDTFQIGPINLSVAVWVGFLALFGIATDDGVVMGTYLKQSFERDKPNSIDAIRESTIVAGKRRIRPCLMTTATTILALLPILTSTGRGSDIMIPMAIPSVGGMAFELLTMLVVPVLFCLARELEWKWRPSK